MRLQVPSFDAWRGAERAAEVAELALQEARMQSWKSREPSNLTEQEAVALALRQRAHDLFDQATREMSALADAVQQRSGSAVKADDTQRSSTSGRPTASR